MIRDKNLHNKVLEYRKKGFSYNQISSVLNIPKSTIAGWLSNLKWSSDIKRELILKNNITTSNRVKQYNTTIRSKTLLRYKEYENEATEEYKKLSENPLFLIGLSLYWGEGEKTDNGRVGVINSDPRMIEIIAKFYREILIINESKIRCAMFLYPDNDLEKCKSYWHRITKIDKKYFIKTQFLKSRSTNTKRKLKYGICNIYFTDVKINIKIRKWIDILHTKARV